MTARVASVKADSCWANVLGGGSYFFYKVAVTTVCAAVLTNTCVTAAVR